MRLLMLLILSGSAMATELKGVLINGSGEGTATAESVQLILMENNMRTLASLPEKEGSVVEGSFTMHIEEDLTGKKLLLQATKDGVLYSQAVENIDGPVHLTVYNVASEAALRTTISSMALYGYAQTLDIGLFYNIRNISEPKVTLNRPEGSFSFGLIPGGSGLEASTSRGRMPLRQQLKVEGGTATLNYNLKPGPTQLMVRTHHVYNPSEENLYTVPLPPNQRVLKLLVLPTTLELEGEGVEFMAEDKKEGMKLYEFQPEEGQTELVIKVKGKPLDKPMDAPAKANASQQTSSHTGKVESRPHGLNKYRWAIIGSVLALFGCFVVVGFRR